MTPAFVLAADAFKGPSIDFYRMSPLLVLLGGGLVLLVAAALTGEKWPRGGFAFVSVASSSAACVLAVFLWHDVADKGDVSLAARALSLDRFSLFLTFTITIAAALTSLFLDQYLRRERMDGPEVHALVLLSALGGVVIGQEVGRALGIRAIFAERQDGALTLRRGFVIAENDRVLVVEDVLTTGGSTR